MKGKILRFSKHNPEKNRTGIYIKVEGNGEVWYSHYGSTETLKPFKINDEIEFTAEKDKITSIKKIVMQETKEVKQEPVLTPKANTINIFDNETSKLNESWNIVKHFMNTNEVPKTIQKELFFKVYEQLKLDERTQFINEANIKRWGK
uniref:Uncharacterized protein n=1 Tax=viral metagenome TaxID=1070528 RepID=A0A6H1ZYK7_9ZZZZ